MVADMNADAGRRYRLYPSAGQAERLTRWGHTCRAVWNVALAQRQFAWSQRRVALRAVDQCRHLTGARTELDWIRFRLSRPLGGPARNVTVSRDGLGWHVAFGVATGAKPAPPNGLPGCGVDFGVA